MADLKIAATLSAQNKGKARGGSVSGRSSPEIASEEAGLLTGVRAVKEPKGYVWVIFLYACIADDGFWYRTPVPASMRVTRSILYAAQVFLSFFLMLVFMTYNVRIGYCIIFLSLYSY